MFSQAELVQVSVKIVYVLRGILSHLLHFELLSTAHVLLGLLNKF